MPDTPAAACTDKPIHTPDTPPPQWQQDAACQAWTKPGEVKPSPSDTPASAAHVLPQLTIDSGDAPQAPAQDTPTATAQDAPPAPANDTPATTAHDTPPSQAQPSPKQSWTVAIDLTTDLPNSPDPSKQYGAHSQLRQLSDLASQTQGKDVTMVVQIPHDSATGQGETPQSPQTIDRYVIRDGQIQKLESEPSQGMAANLQHLLERATSIAPSDKLALISQSHGAGAEGIGGGTGSATMSQLTDAIKNGLKGSGHDKVDVLDFDSCEMGTAPVLAEASQVASRVVASEEPEHAGNTHDAQSLKSVMSDLLQHPDLSAKDLSDDFVHAADRGANGTPSMDADSSITHTGTDTLGSFDSAKYAKFSSALDSLGSALTAASAEDKNKGAIEKVIDGTQQLPLDPDAPKDISSRDVAEFCQSLKQAVDNGSIQDTDGSIKRSADAVLAAQSDMTSAFHVDHSSTYDQLGGLDTFIPGTETRDDQAKAAQMSPVKTLSEASSPQRAADAYENRDKVVSQFEGMTKQFAQGLSPDGQKAYAPVVDAVKQLQEASTKEDFDKAFQGLHHAAESLTGTAAEKEMLDHEVTLLRQFKSGLVSDRDVPGVPHWNQFVHEMAGLS